MTKVEVYIPQKKYVLWLSTARAESYGMTLSMWVKVYKKRNTIMYRHHIINMPNSTPYNSAATTAAAPKGKPVTIAFFTAPLPDGVIVAAGAVKDANPPVTVNA